MTIYIYIVEIEPTSQGQRTYVGITNDLHRRFNEEGRRGWLSRQVRIRMIYCDSLLYHGTPRGSEKWIKAWRPSRKLDLVNRVCAGTYTPEHEHLDSLTWRPFWHRTPEGGVFD